MSEYDNLRRMQKKREILGNFGFFFTEATPDFGSWHSAVKIIMYF